MVEAALESLDQEVKAQMAAAKGSGQPVLAVNDGRGGDLIQVSDSEPGNVFDPQKAVFSAKITAHKPN
jgi:propanediol dehydratase small subunit